MTILVLFSQIREASMRIVLLFYEILNQFLISLVHAIDLSRDQSIHGLNVLFNFAITLINRDYSVILVLSSSENTVGAQQFLFGLAVNGDVAIMLQASHGVLGSNKQSIRV